MAAGDGTHNEINAPVDGNVAQIGVVYGDVVFFAGPGAEEVQATLAGQLASRVRALSVQDEEHRGLHDPPPLSVSWRTASDELFDHWENIRGSADGAATSPVQLEGRLSGIGKTYDAVPSRRLVILGRAGAGKTVLANRLILNLLGERQRTDRVPVLFSVSDWNPRFTGLRAWLTERLVRDFPFLGNRDQAGKQGAEALVEDDWILPVLDGFDEIPSRYHFDAISEISRVSGPMVVTSRPEEYRRAAKESSKTVGRAAAIELDKISLDEAERYLRASTSKARATAWDGVFDRLRTEPEEAASQNLLPVLTTPLMVMLSRTIYNDNPDHAPSDLLDVSRFSSCRNLEEHLLSAYLDTVYDPRRNEGPLTGESARPKWNPEQARNWLGYLATHLNRRNTHDLS